MQCELYHWTEVLDRFDTILSSVTQHESGTGCIFMCPKLTEPKVCVRACVCVCVYSLLSFLPVISLKWICYSVSDEMCGHLLTECFIHSSSFLY